MSAQTVFVDGASGFNATWEIQTHLQRGFDVVASVRSPSKGEFLQSLFGPTYGRRFSYIITPRRRRLSVDSDATSEGSLSSLLSSPENHFVTALGDSRRGQGSTWVLESLSV